MLPVYVILSRTGTFLVCNRRLPGAGKPVVGRWRATTSGLLEFTITHFVWSATLPMGVPVRACGHPVDPIVPYELGERATLQARVEGRSFLWPFNWGESERPLCIPVEDPQDAWVVPYLDFDIPTEAVYGGGSDGTLAGTYSLERSAFAATLRAAGFDEPEDLAAASKVELEIRSNGTFELHRNRAWVDAKSRKPVRAEGRWIARGGELYLRLLSDSGQPIDGILMMWLHPEEGGLYFRAPNGDARPGEDPTDYTYDTSFRVVKRSR